MANNLEINTELREQRRKKAPRRLDDNPEGSHLDAASRLKVEMFFSMLDRIQEQLTERFPSQLRDFAYLQLIHTQVN